LEDILVCECKNISLKEVLKCINSGCKSIDELQKELPVGQICSMCLSSENDPQGERAVHLDKLLKSLKEK